MSTPNTQPLYTCIELLKNAITRNEKLRDDVCDGIRTLQQEISRRTKTPPDEEKP